MALTWSRRRFAGISVDLTGGLGNQLFGFAAGWTQARRLGVPLGLRHRRRPGETPRSFALEWLLDPPQVAMCSRPPRSTFREHSFAYDPAVDAVEPGTRLVGYFQSWRYSNAYAEGLRTCLFEHGLVLAQETDPFIAVHARRGDYLGARQMAFHGVCQEDYYINGVRELRAMLGDIPTRVFSDDVAFGQQLAAHIPDAAVGGDVGPAEQVLAQMAQARGLVISNSSFSWWAAWLAGTSATVIAPTPWFSDPAMPTEDLLPPSWLVRPRTEPFEVA